MADAAARADNNRSIIDQRPRRRLIDRQVRRPQQTSHPAPIFSLSPEIPRLSAQQPSASDSGGSLVNIQPD